MKPLLLAACLLLSACAVSPVGAQPAGCPPQGHDRARLEQLKAADWEMPGRERARFARAIAACVASPDPLLRDGVAFEALSHLLRQNQLEPAVRIDLTRDMLQRLQAQEGEGFERPFAALVLSELARADRVSAYYDDSLRHEVLERAIAYFVGVRDYRGFDEREGWRHGVAHGADLMLQLTLNPALGRDELVRIRDAIATQLAPEGHAYVFGESERLARPIIFMAQRGVFSEEEWRAWLVSNTAVGADAFTSENGLARRHDVMGFLNALYMNASLSANADDNALLPGVEAALRALP